jgi:hypothetical protein
MNIFQKTDEFDAWLLGLKDRVGKAQIALHLDRAIKGNSATANWSVKAFPRCGFTMGRVTECILPGVVRCFIYC